MKNLGKYKEVREQVQSSVKERVPDPHHFYTNPDPAFHFNADPDPTFPYNPDLDTAHHHSAANLRPLVKLDRPSTPPL
jgi:hypothetical protein